MTGLRACGAVALDFPDGVVSVTASLQSVPWRVLPEAILLVRASTARRLEFALGRQCARDALGLLGFVDAPIPIGPGRAPRWPAGAVGSISHGAGLCWAVAARADAVATIGVDVEEEAAVPASLTGVVMRPEEIGRKQDAVGLLFCIKEAVFKAFYPIADRFLDFQQVSVELDDVGHAFVAVAIETAETPALRFEGRWQRDGDRVLAAAWRLPRRACREPDRADAALCTVSRRRIDA